jgi:hypothetical protein
MILIYLENVLYRAVKTVTCITFWNPVTTGSTDTQKNVCQTERAFYGAEICYIFRDTNEPNLLLQGKTSSVNKTEV